MKNLLVIWTVLVTSYGSCRKLPSSFIKCDVKSPNFEECLTEAVPDAIRQLTKPHRKWGLPSMDPLTIPAMSIEPDSDIVGFEQNYTDFKVWGFTNISCSNIQFDFEGKNMTMNCSTPQIRVETDYLFNGSIKVLPIYGNGTGKIVLDKVNCYHAYYFKEYLRKERRHWKVTNSSVDINPSHVTFQFDNLYENEKLLGDNVNLVLNDNWEQIYAGLKPSYEIAFARVFQALFNSLLKRVPISNLFING